MNAPTSDWISMLNTDLATLPLAQISGSALQSILLSSATREDVIKAMIGHLKHVISGPAAYRLGAGLIKAKAGVDAVFSIKSGKDVERPLLSLQAPLLGFGAGLAVWLLPGGDFSGGITWGLLIAATAWIWKALYRHGTAEISASIIGKYCYQYCAVLEKLGADKRATSEVISKAPNANPFASYLTGLGTIGIVTALACANNYYSASRIASDKASALAARTASGEWIQDWTMNVNGNRLIARLYEEGEGKLILRGFDTSWRRVVSDDPRWTVQLTECSTTQLAVSCAASYSIIGRNEYQGIPGRFDLDFAKRAGRILATSPNEPPFTMIVGGTPSSLRGAPRALLQHAARGVDGPRSALSDTGAAVTVPFGSGPTALLPTKREGVREQLEAQARIQETAARQQAEQELANQRKVEQAAEAQRRVARESEARSRYDIAMAEAQKVYEQVLADARSAHQQVQSLARLDSQEVLAEAQKKHNVEQSAAQVKNQLAQQLVQKVPALQATARAAFQQDQAAAQARFQQTQASVQARQRQAELESTTVYQQTQAEAQSVLKQARAEAQKQYQIERENGPVQISKAPAAVAAPVPAPESTTSPNPQMAQDDQTNCKLWKPNLSPGEGVSWSGACIDGYASGKGIARWSSGGVESLVYEGVFRSGVLQGRGVMIAAGGDRYEGDYKDGKRDGKGVYTTSAGQRYAGEFSENKKHGAGVVTDANGVSAQVKFRNGQQVN